MLREDLSRNFGFLLNDVARLMRTAYDRRIRKLGLTRAQWWVLTHLYRSNGVSQTELAETLEIEKPTLGRLLDRLEAKGWVRREHDASDRRVWRVHLTDEVEPALRTMRNDRRGTAARCAHRDQRRRARALRRHAARDQGKPPVTGTHRRQAGARAAAARCAAGASAAVALYFYAQGGRHLETENAYVKAHIVAVSAEVAGRVAEVAVRDNQAVAQGQLLFRIDTRAFRDGARARQRAAGERAHRRGNPARRATAWRSPTPPRPRSASASWPCSWSASGA